MIANEPTLRVLIVDDNRGGADALDLVRSFLNKRHQDL